MAQPVDELLESLPTVGLRLNNLFQLESGGWQANVCDTAGPKEYFQFGRADTAAGALIAAINAAGVKVSDDLA